MWRRKVAGRRGGRVAEQAGLIAGRPHTSGPHIGRDSAVEFVGTGFGDDLDDAAGSLTVLRLEGGRLNVDFLDEGQVYAHAQSAPVAVVGAEAAEGLVGSVDAVHQVEVLKAGGATDRGVRAVPLGVNTAARDHARRQGKDAGYVAGKGKRFIELVSQWRGKRRVRGVDLHRAGFHLHSIRHCTDLKVYVKRGGASGCYKVLF